MIDFYNIKVGDILAYKTSNGRYTVNNERCALYKILSIKNNIANYNSIDESVDCHTKWHIALSGFSECYNLGNNPIIEGDFGD